MHVLQNILLFLRCLTVLCSQCLAVLMDDGIRLDLCLYLLPVVVSYVSYHTVTIRTDHGAVGSRLGMVIEVLLTIDPKLIDQPPVHISDDRELDSALLTERPEAVSTFRADADNGIPRGCDAHIGIVQPFHIADASFCRILGQDIEQELHAGKGR